MKNDRTYRLKQIGDGWQCKVSRYRTVGWGSTAGLAILDWVRQHRLWELKEAKHRTRTQ